MPNGGKIDENLLEDTTPRKRGGQGVTAMNTDCITGAISVESESEILLITSNGQAVRCPVNNIRETNRGSKGVKLVNLSGKDKLIAVSEVIELDEGDVVDEDAESIQDSSENTFVSDLSSDQINPIE